MAKGTVAWKQNPSQASDTESKLSTEFVGELTLAHWPSQQATITGSFLTADGDYYTVDLQDPQRLVAQMNAKLGKAGTVDLQVPQGEPLPTLLTGAGGCTPKGATTPTHFYSKI